MRLERVRMLQVEGGTHGEYLMILRPEAGHAIQHACRRRGIARRSREDGE